MSKSAINSIGFFLLLSYPILLNGQISGTNLMEYQHGKIPGDTSAISTVYDRAIVKYTYNDFKAAVALEQFHTPFESRNYTRLTQYSLQYSSDMLDVKIGNLYETIGRGLLLRSYEIPGAILEDLSYRSRHYFHRDIAGFSTKFRHKNLSAKVLYGKPLNYVFPPNQDENERRPDIVEAIYSDYSLKNHTIGGAFLRLTNNSQSEMFGMATASGNITSFLSYYTEMAKNISSYSPDDFSAQVPYAFYGGLNLTAGSLGVSAEYKKYNNFIIGTGINEPPALVKEHSFKLLNRSTHVLQPFNEKGYQFEVFYTLPDLSTLTLNNTLAINEFGKRFLFREYFIEYDFSILKKHNARIFADYAEDPFKLESKRISAGSYLEWNISNSSSLKTDFEFQTFNRLAETVQNQFVSLSYLYKSKFVFNLTGEFSNDAFVSEKSNKTWIGANVKYKINHTNSIQMFAGQRRGGPACNAGVCYEVLDFEGIELRLTSRF